MDIGVASFSIDAECLIIDEGLREIDVAPFLIGGGSLPVDAHIFH